MMTEKEFIYKVGNRIKQKKDERGMSYSDLEAKTGIDRSAIVKICNNGDQNLTLKTIFRLATALEVEPYEILK